MPIHMGGHEDTVRIGALSHQQSVIAIDGDSVLFELAAKHTKERILNPHHRRLVHQGAKQMQKLIQRYRRLRHERAIQERLFPPSPPRIAIRWQTINWESQGPGD